MQENCENQNDDSAVRRTPAKPLQVLIVNHYLRGFTGAETHVLQLIDYFKSRGDDVLLAGFVLRDPFLSAARRRNVRVVPIWFALRRLRSGFDVIWTHQQSGFLLVHSIVAARARIHLHNFLSYFVRLEQLPFRQDQGIPTHLKLLANSPETRDKLQKGKRNLPIQILYNLVPRSFYKNVKSVYKDKVKNIAVVSNHMPEEVRDAIAILKYKGISVTVFGIGNEYREIDSLTLIDFDVVITIGKTVQYAIVQGIPVFVYDHFGGPGYMERAEFAIHEYANFSGRSKPNKLKKDEIVENLVSKYKSALKDSEYFREQFSWRYSADSQLDSLLSEIGSERTPVLSMRDRIAAMLRALFREPLILGYLFAPTMSEKLSSDRPNLKRAYREWRGRRN